MDTDALIAGCIAYDRKNGVRPGTGPTEHEEDDTMQSPGKTTKTEARTTVVVVPLDKHARIREALRREGVLTLETPSNGKKVSGADLDHFLDTYLPDNLVWHPAPMFPVRSDVHPGTIYALKDLGEIRTADPALRAPTTSSVFRNYLRDRSDAPIFARIPAASSKKADELLSDYASPTQAVLSFVGGA